jgi:hypothetical protein
MPATRDQRFRNRVRFVFRGDFLRVARTFFGNDLPADFRERNDFKSSSRFSHSIPHPIKPIEEAVIRGLFLCNTVNEVLGEE